MKLIAKAQWLDGIETRLRLKFPTVARRFLDTHEFIGLEADSFCHYHNTDSDDPWSLPIAIFRDKFIIEPAVAAGFIPVGQPDEVNYDRICLDMNRLSKGDCPLVQLDHEQLLQLGRVWIVKEVCPSYQHFIGTLKKYIQL